MCPLRYEEMGTQLALQYGGSQAVGTPNSNAARDFLQSVKRFYRNTCARATARALTSSRSRRLAPPLPRRWGPAAAAPFF